LDGQPGILVADDEPAIRSMLEMVLSAGGFRVWTAADGQEAFDCYREHRDDIDLVLLDVFMPGMDGPQALEALGRFDPEVRCCFMSGHAGEYSLQQLRHLGASCFFLKPLDLPRMLEMLGLQAGLSASARRRQRAAPARQAARS